MIRFPVPEQKDNSPTNSKDQSKKESRANTPM